MELLCIISLYFAILCSMLTSSNAIDTIFPTQEFRDGDIIVSSNELFQLGFFSLGNSNNRYLGIRYIKVSNGTVVWVANRDTPINNTSGILQVSGNGILHLITNDNTTIWSSSLGSLNNLTPVAQLLDNGNFVVRNESRNNDDEIFIWQSFDYPGDTYLLGMKFGKDLRTGIDRRWVSWKSVDDPSQGQYSAYMDTNGYPQIFEKRGSVFYTRFGPWNGVRFNGMPSLRANPTSVNQFVLNETDIYYRYEVNDMVISRMYLNPEGGVTRMNWVNLTQSWFPILTSAPTDSCAGYGLCGAFGTCNTNNFPVCSCMEGFEPKRPEEWNVADWSSGCVRRVSLDCGNGNGNGNEDRFKSVSGVKLPDTRSSWYNVSMTLGECEIMCRTNCSCVAYANLDIRNGGSGCLLWFNELMDVREYDETQIMYIRMAASEFTSLITSDSRSNKKKSIIIVVASTLGGLVLVGLSLAMYARSKKKRSYLKRKSKVNSL